MKTYKFAGLLVLIFSALTIHFSCERINNCSGYDCFTPPETFYFDIVDADDQVNVFSSGMVDRDNLEVVDELDGWVKHEFLSYSDTNLLVLPEISWKMGEARYSLFLNDTLTIELLLNMEEKYENCCTFFNVVDFDVLNQSWFPVDSLQIVRVEIQF